MNNPAISVVVPVYKAEKYLKECVDSILSQTFTDFELILVDDCSPDNSPQMCDEYAKKDKRIKVLHHKVNQGSIAAYRDGVNASAGEYIQFVDSDDWIEKNMFERLYQKTVSEGCDFVYCDVIRFTTEDNQLYPDTTFDSRGREKKEIVICMIEDKFPQYMPNKLFKKNLFNNLVWPEFMLREDTVIVIQLLLNAEKVGYEYSILYHYRFNKESISSNNKKRYRQIKEVYENYKKLNNILKSRPEYELYRPTLEKMVNSSKSNDRFKAFYYIKRFFMAFVPYGIIAAYRKS